MPLNSDKLQRIFKKIYEGAYTAITLPKSLYLSTAKAIETFLDKGYGNMTFDVNTPDWHTYTQLRNNVYIFSAAKTHQNVRDIASEVFDKNGFRRKFKDFKERADIIQKTQYDHWLKAEQNTAEAQARAARQWLQIQKTKDILPFLMYETVGDDRVRPDHQTLEGITRRVDDPFWNTHYPPNGFNCRCIVRQLDDATVTPIPKDVEQPDPLFNSNVGQTKYVFSPRHPFFKVEKSFRTVARKNFNLPIPLFK